jgi:tetratricopeptide (TPR) repeat protein
MSETTPPSKETTEKQPATRSYSIWLGFASRELTSRGSVRIQIRWGRVLVLMLLMGVLFWIGKSVGLYFFFKNVRDFEDVSFTDMVLFPANRSNVRIQQGNYQIDQAKAALEREDYRRAFSLLREGVARSPANLEGRMLLAQIYAGWRPDLATDILVDGVDYGLEDPEYVKLMSTLLLMGKEDDRILELTTELLEKNPPEDIQRILNVMRMQSAMYQGQYGIVREIFESTDLDQTMDGVIIGTSLYVKTGKADTAAEVLLSVIKASQGQGADLNQIYSRLVNVYKGQKEYDKAREAALELVIGSPLEWRPRIMLIDILSASGKTDRRDREIDALLQEHRNDEQAMTALAQLSAEYGNVRASSRLYDLALENGYNLSLFSLSLAEAYVSNGEPQRAIELCNELVREDPSWLLSAESSFNAIRALAYYTGGDSELGNLYLKNFLESTRTNVNQLYQASRSYRKYDLNEQALKILEEAYERDSENESILISLIDVEMDLGAYFAINEHLKQLFDLRRPDYETIESIHQRLQSDRFLFTEDRVALLERLEDLLQERDSVDWDIWERQPVNKS